MGRNEQGGVAAKFQAMHTGFIGRCEA